MINNIDMAIMKQIEAEGISNPLMARALLANMDKIAEQLAAKDFGQMMTLDVRCQGRRPELQDT